MVALTLMPVALLFLHRAMESATIASVIAAILSSAAVVLTNAFGALDLAVGGVCILLAVRAGSAVLTMIGMAAYLLISPWLPPSLINLMRRDQWSAAGHYSQSTGPLALLAAIAVFALLAFFARRIHEFGRFAILLAFWMIVIPVGYFAAGLTIAPQASRYQLELELAICILFGFACSRSPYRTPLMIGLAAAAIWQAVLFREFARTLIRPVEITGTIEHKVDQWLGKNAHGGRVAISGDPEYLYNVWFDSPQLAGGHEPTVPNWEARVATFLVYTGANAGPHDAEYSLLWLQAFGNQAIYVPGAHSRESSHAVLDSLKFAGSLPVLWRDEDDTIYAVPQRSSSLAHVIPKEAAVNRPPIHGLDVDPLRPYVAALTDSTLPLASISWSDEAHARIQAMVNPGQIVSVQETYAPGWSARANGAPAAVRADGIGLMLIEPRCNGPCLIELNYARTREGWFCDVFSALVVSAMVLALGRGFRLRIV
jgi:hypothetical protein